MDLGYRYGGEAAVFITIAMRLIPRLIRMSREARETGDVGIWGMSLMPSKPKPTALGSLASLSVSMTPEQQARVMAMISETPAVATGHEVEHRCPKCGTLIHADVMHGGFAPCRKCGWSPSPGSASSPPTP
jgi:hypothetical protein